MERSFDEWFAVAYPRIVKSLTVLVGDADVAGDAASEAFERAYARWRRVDSMEAPTGWVHRVALNVARRRLRRAAMERRLFAAQHDFDVTTSADAAVVVDVRRAVNALPERQRIAVVLRYAGQFTQNEIAEAMGVAPGTVAATLHAARRSLASVLRTDGVSSEATHD